jgi:hypothetical protein
MKLLAGINSNLPQLVPLKRSVEQALKVDFGDAEDLIGEV